MATVEPATRGREAVSRPGRVLRPGVALLIVLVLVAVAGLGIAVGTKSLSFGDVWRALFVPGTGTTGIIVWQLRIPRTVLGILVGANLGVAGVLMQTLTRNRLAEPGLLGVNSGAAFAVVLAIWLAGATAVADYVWFAFAGAAAAAAGVYLLGGRGRGTEHSRVRLVLAGAALSATLGAGTGIVTMFDSTAFDSYRFWVVGALTGRGLDTVAAIAPFTIAGLVLALALGPSLNMLALGDELGTALGLRVFWVRVLGFAAVVVLTGSATAAAGPVAFVGLVVPHVLRMLLGPDVRWLLLCSLGAGPILVLISDIVGRVVARPGELELGIVTAFIGAPFLLALVLRRGGAGR
ncbi:iron ABC transporter permease [Amycolatopsis sp. GM8]|uniref:FecCD family ABC transporter permease n=1 Tax=Amycolatopsis sp. GM8 TaxID=2896530 RepID=UPI001F1A1925|nr:iron chelate uptake ABC transporter family permease subunit [Amycolatopsis sp. GM8]